MSVHSSDPSQALDAILQRHGRDPTRLLQILIDAQDIDLVNSNCTGRAESLRRAGVKGVGSYR